MTPKSPKKHQKVPKTPEKGSKRVEIDPQTPKWHNLTGNTCFGTKKHPKWPFLVLATSWQISYLPQNSEKVGNRGKSSKNEKNLPVKITKLKNGIPGIPGISGRSAGKNEKTTSAFGPQNRLKSAGSGVKISPHFRFLKTRVRISGPWRTWKTGIGFDHPWLKSYYKSMVNWPLFSPPEKWSQNQVPKMGFLGHKISPRSTEVLCFKTGEFDPFFEVSKKGPKKGQLGLDRFSDACPNFRRLFSSIFFAQMSFSLLPMGKSDVFDPKKRCFCMYCQNAYINQG